MLEYNVKLGSNIVLKLKNGKGFVRIVMIVMIVMIVRIVRKVKVTGDK